MTNDNDDLPHGIILWTCAALLAWGLLWAWLT